MNKIIFILLLLISSLYSDEKLYIGTSIGSFSEKLRGDLEAQNSAIMTTIKLGYGEQKAYAIEFSFDKINTKSEIFSQNDRARFSVNLEFIKAFDFFKYLHPFFKVGIGAGSLKIDRELQKTLNYSSLNLGVGTLIPINEHFDFEIGYGYRYISYEKLNTITKSNSIKSDLNTAYFGLNVRY